MKENLKQIENNARIVCKTALDCLDMDKAIEVAITMSKMIKWVETLDDMWKKVDEVSKLTSKPEVIVQAVTLISSVNKERIALERTVFLLQNESKTFGANDDQHVDLPLTYNIIEDFHKGIVNVHDELYNLFILNK